MVDQALRLRRAETEASQKPISVPDRGLLLVYLGLLLFGLIMVASASINKADSDFGQPFFYVIRHGVRTVLALLLVWVAWHIPLKVWRENGLLLMLASIFLLAFVLAPGVGITANGATRWLNLGLFTLQVSELAKLFLVIYLSGYLVRRADEVSSGLVGFLKPMLVLGVASALLVMEPDFGAMVMLLMTGMAMLFVGGVRFDQFMFVLLGTLAVIAVLAVSVKYRADRIDGFLDPWADPYDKGFQLVQSLIAIGSAGWAGTGLGGSIQKLFYLPEAHTDFIYAIIAEELGLLGAGGLILAYVFLLWRCFSLARRVQQQGELFGGYFIYGVAMLILLQVYINIGVNLGVLPTKGLTLPFISYGGNSLLSLSFAIGIIFRVQFEADQAANQVTKSTNKRRQKKPENQDLADSAEGSADAATSADETPQTSASKQLDDIADDDSPPWEQTDLLEPGKEPRS